MPSRRLWARTVGVDRRVVIEAVDEVEGDESIVVSCRLRKGAKLRCGTCERRSGRYDTGEGRRRWRALDAGTAKVFIEADAPRVKCRDHGVTVAWRTVGAIAGRVVTDARALADPFDGLVRIGIDEISYRRGHKYLMVVVDHDTGRLVWAKACHDRATLQEFFDLLGPERAAKIRLISADAAEWIGECATTNSSRTPSHHPCFTSCAGPPRPSTLCVAGCGTHCAASVSVTLGASNYTNLGHQRPPQQ